MGLGGRAGVELNPGVDVEAGDCLSLSTPVSTGLYRTNSLSRTLLEVELSFLSVFGLSISSMENTFPKGGGISRTCGDSSLLFPSKVSLSRIPGLGVLPPQLMLALLLLVFLFHKYVRFSSQM